jgi:hypothetical protein
VSAGLGVEVSYCSGQGFDVGVGVGAGFTTGNDWGSGSGFSARVGFDDGYFGGEVGVLAGGSSYGARAGYGSSGGYASAGSWSSGTAPARYGTDLSAGADLSQIPGPAVKQAADGEPEWVNPTGQAIRGCDSQGCGGFGATRKRATGTGIHAGADYLATPGQEVGSPAGGLLVREARPYANDPRFGGAEVVTPSGYRIKLFYLDVDQRLIGAIIGPGSRIGAAQDISMRYPGTPPHVHVEVRDPKGALINPAKMIPSP